jgi:predicted TIM-barrel fold metal-dependent hydrolase
MLVIDAHAHVYSPDEWRYPPTPEARRPPPGIGSLDHLQRTCKAAGVAAAVVIQTHAFYRWDNRYLCDLARKHADWIACVCALDPEDPKSPSLLTEFVRDYSVRGVRVLTLNSGHLDVPEVRRIWAKASELGLVINLVASSAHADQVASLLRAYPDTPTVLEHSLCINRANDPAENLHTLGRLSDHPNAFVELCDLPVVSRESFPFRDVHTLYVKMVDLFGAERCTWGSGFPTEFWVEKASVAEAIDVFSHHLPLDDSARAQVLGGTAARLWFPKLVHV